MVVLRSSLVVLRSSLVGRIRKACLNYFRDISSVAMPMG